MIVSEKYRFAQCFNRLAVALRLSPDEADAAMQQVYWEALATQPIDAVEDAARKIAQTAQWFPKTSEWLSVAEEARSARALAAVLPHPRDEPWHSECSTCDDTGWETRTCEGDKGCGRFTPHAKHSYTEPCYCRPTNRTYQRKLEEQRVAGRRRHAAAAE